MPVIMDLSNIMISTLMAQLGRHTNAEVNEDQLRHMILNTIRSNRKKFFQEYGELVIAADDRNYWRKQTFPYYKAMRKKHRESSEIDWNKVFEALNNIKQEIKDIFPYKVVQVDNAEADDVIATICMENGQQLASGERFLILSSDKDMGQLQKFANIDQFDPVRKRWIKVSNPEEFLIEHILKGDSSDGIPNILSQDDTFVAGVRQKPMTKKKIEAFKEDINNMDAETKRNFERNKLLIDLSCVPENIQSQVMEQYNTEKGFGREKLFNYFIEKRLRNLMDTINEF